MPTLHFAKHKVSQCVRFAKQASRDSWQFAITETSYERYVARRKAWMIEARRWRETLRVLEMPRSTLNELI